MFLPFLLLYLLVGLLPDPTAPTGAESRYFRLAGNLLQGYFSPPPPDIDLWVGPGYPLFIAFFLWFGAPWVVLKLLHAVFLFLSVILFYKAARHYAAGKKALFFSFALALYYPIYGYIPLVLPETLSWFLLTLVFFLYLRNFRRVELSWRKVVPAALALSFLALTEVRFGNALLGVAVLSALALFWKRRRPVAGKVLAIFSFAFLFCLPYLMYTYFMTGKPLYWSNAGGMSFYTLSTPYEGETGERYEEDELFANPNHVDFLMEVQPLKPVEKDRAYRQEAFRNIAAQPLKFLDNVAHNAGRLLFFPSRSEPRRLATYAAFPVNLFVVVLIALALIVAARQYKQLSPEMAFLLVFVLMYLGGSLLVSANRGMFYLTVPFWMLFIQYAGTQLISIRWKRS